MRVLVAEDSSSQAARLRADLESQGFAVIVTHDGAEALEVTRKERPDVILSDVLMPEMDGFRLCREVQADAELRSIPVVLRTFAFGEEEDRDLALESGAYDCIQKDLEGEELGSLLRDAVEARAGALGRGAALDGQGFQGRYADRLLHRLVQEAAEMERTNEALQATQQRLQGILDHSPMCMYVKDLEGRYVLANKQFERVIGLGSEDIVGKTDEQLFGGDQGGTFSSHDRRVLDCGVTSDFEESLLQEDGLHTYLSTKFPLRNSEGDVYALCGVSADVTQRKQLEERLQQAEKMEAIGRLAGGIAHDFNNLLSVIQNYTDFATEGLDDEDPRRQDLREVSEAAERGTNLVSQLMTFSRGRSVTTESLSVNALIEGMAGLLRASAGGSNSFISNLDPELPLITINRGHLEQILVNLVVNARDAMPGGGEVRVETSRTDLERSLLVGDCQLEPGSYVRLSVSDTGAGISPETMGRIFEPFFTTKPEGMGTGLGLATVHGIVEEAGGCITVDSERGKGTTFTIYLPAGDRSATGAVERVTERRGNGVEGRTVLVTDDEPAMRQIIRRTLVQHGYDVLTAASGEEALEIYARRDGEVQLLITDVIMPGMLGTELAEHLTASNPELEVIYISGYEGMEQGKGRTLPDGGAFISKPFAAAHLLAEVRSVLGSESPPAISPAL